MTATALRSEAVAALARLRTDYGRWAERCYRIRDKHGAIRPLVLKRAQHHVGAVEQAQLRAKGEARIFILKARQGGFSTDQQARNLHQIWSEPLFDALTLAHERDATDKIFEISARAIEHFPRALLPKLGARETREISFPRLDTHFFTGTAGAKRTGRGLTIKRFHGSEFAFWPTPASTLAAVTPALVPKGSVVVLETTASGYDSDGHNFWREARAKGYEPLFFPWWECDPENYRLPLLEPDELGALSGEEDDLLARYALDREQLKWRRKKVDEMGRTDFLTEYAEDEESCWAAAGGMFYDPELLKALLLRAPTPLETDLGGALERYGEPDGERVIIGVDTSEGAGGDRSAWTARAFPSWRLLAKFEDAEIEPKAFAQLLNAWGRRFGFAFLVVEKNFHGITVLRELRDALDYPTDYIFHRTPLDTTFDQTTDRIGWHTSGETKPLLLDAGRALLRAARDGMIGVPSRAALRDAFGVRRGIVGTAQINGKDVLVSEMLCWVGREAMARNQSAGGARVHL